MSLSKNFNTQEKPTKVTLRRIPTIVTLKQNKDPLETNLTRDLISKCNIFTTSKKEKKKKKHKNNGDNIKKANSNHKFLSSCLDDRNSIINLDNNINIKKISPIFFADEFIKNNNVVYLDGLRMYQPETGCYKCINKHQLETLLISYIPIHYKKSLSRQIIRDTAYFLTHEQKIQIDAMDLPKNPLKINCLNGVYELDSGQFLEHNPNFMFMNCLQANITPDYDIESTRFYQYLNQVTDRNLEMQNRIQEAMGYTFSNLTNAKKAVFLYGASNSGKSVLLNLIKAIVGRENVSHLDFHKLSDEKHVGTLMGMIANVCYEINNSALKDIGTFKSLVSDDEEITARPIYCNPFSFSNKATLLFSSNFLPQMKYSSTEDTRAFINRILLVHFPFEVKETHQDKNLLEKLIKEKDVIFTWAIQGLIRYIQNDFKFSSCDECDNILTGYNNQINPIASFIEERCNYELGNYSYKEDVDNCFTDFCIHNGYDAPTKSSFKSLKEQLEKNKKLVYRRINRNGMNKYGFENLQISFI